MRWYKEDYKEKKKKKLEKIFLKKKKKKQTLRNWEKEVKLNFDGTNDSLDVI